MLKILHKGLQVNLDLDTSGFTGDVQQDSALPYILSLVGGKQVGVNVNGKVQLADGLPASLVEPLGFLINDAAGYFFENKPALASLKVAVCVGPMIGITDQIDTDLVFLPGQKLYAGTGDKTGLVTNVPASGATVIAISLSAASSANPLLTFLLK